MLPVYLALWWLRYVDLQFFHWVGSFSAFRSSKVILASLACPLLWDLPRLRSDRLPSNTRVHDMQLEAHSDESLSVAVAHLI